MENIINFWQIVEFYIIPVVFFIISLINFCKNKHKKYSLYIFCIQLIFNTVAWGYCSAIVLLQTITANYYSRIKIGPFSSITISHGHLYLMINLINYSLDAFIFAIWGILYSLFLFVLLRIYKKINDKPLFYVFYLINIGIIIIYFLYIIILLTIYDRSFNIIIIIIFTIFILIPFILYKWYYSD